MELYVTRTKESADSLMHHGILGMKWGVRRYQNEDGTLTSKGKERYREDKRQYKEDKKKAFQVGQLRNDRLRNRLEKTLEKTIEKGKSESTIQTLTENAEISYRVAKSLWKEYDDKKVDEGEAHIKELIDRYGGENFKNFKYFEMFRLLQYLRRNPEKK